MSATHFKWLHDRRQHGKITLKIHWEICRKYAGLECAEKWHLSSPMSVAKNKQVKTMLCMCIWEINGSDITLVLKR